MADQRTLIPDIDLDKLRPASCKGFHTGCQRETKQPKDLQSRCQLRVNDHGKTQLILVKMILPCIIHVPDTGNGMLGSHHMGCHTAQYIQFIGLRHGNPDICLACGKLLQCGIGSAITFKADNIKAVAQTLYHIRVSVDQGQFISIPGKLSGKRTANLAASYNKYFYITA